MKIIITAREALDKCLWKEICNLKGISPYAINEGLMDETEEIVLTEEEAESLHLVDTKEE